MSMMIFSVLFFLGLFIMFFFILRGQETLLKTMRNELAQTRAKLHVLEIRMATLLGEDINPSVGMQDLQMPQQNTTPPKDDKLQLNLDPISEDKF